MDSSNLLLTFVIFLCIVGSAFFSATETAFMSMNKIKLKKMAETNKKAKLALEVSENSSEFISAVLIGNNIVNILATTLATVLFTNLFKNNGPLISTVVMTLTVLVFGEISPKSIAADMAESYAMFVAPAVKVLMFILKPVNWLFVQWKKLLAKIFNLKESKGITEEELITIVDEVQNDGGIDEHEGELIRSAIEFNDLAVEDILTPRVDIIGVEEKDSIDTVKEAFAKHGFSRMPVYRGTIDNIIGVIHEKDFYSFRASGKTDIRKIMQSPVCTTKSTKISDLLRLLQREKTHIAIVIDEFGGTEGIVTLEDILEELVGEIWDEHDEIIEDFKKLSENTYLISCNANLEEMFELLEVKSEYDSPTVSGWVMEEIGHVPHVGDSFEYENLKVTVTKTDFRRVLEIRVVVTKIESDTDEKDRKQK